MIKQILVAASIAAVSPASAATNLIANPGFETGALAPWFNADDASNPFGAREPWNVTAIDAHSGTYSAQAIDNYEIRQNFAPVAVADIAQLSFWFRTPNAPTGALGAIYFYYADSGFDGVTVALTDNDQWQFFDVTYALEAGRMLSGFGVYGYTAGSDEIERVRLDDVALLVNAPEPAAPALLGLGALVLLRRRGRIDA